MKEVKIVDVMSELQTIFRDIFDDDKLIITNETSAANIEAWDSLAHIRLVSAVEKHFGVRFSLGELKDLKNAGDMAGMIARKIEK